MRIRVALLVSASLLFAGLLAGCGEDSPEVDGEAQDPAAATTSQTPSPTPDPTADWPACREVWKDGAVLPGKYRGCRAGDRAVKADAMRCEFGKKIVTFPPRFWAAPDFRQGAKLIIHRTQGPVKKDAAYRDAMTSCTA